MDFSEYFSKKECMSEDTIETEDCSPRELFTILTEFKMFDKIDRAGGSYYGLYEQNGKWQNLKKIFIEYEEAKKEMCNKYTIKLIKIKSKAYMYCFRMFTFSSALLSYAYKANTSYGKYFQLKDMLLYLEKAVPKKRYIVKGIRTADKSIDVLEEISRVYQVGTNDAEHYYDIIDLLPDLEKQILLKQIDRGGKLK